MHKIMVDFKRLIGYYKIKDASIGINIERVWNITKNENKFVNLFTKTYVHEMIHREIRKGRIIEPTIQEEECVCIMSGESKKSINYIWYKSHYK